MELVLLSIPIGILLLIFQVGACTRKIIKAIKSNY